MLLLLSVVFMLSNSSMCTSYQHMLLLLSINTTLFLRCYKRWYDVATLYGRCKNVSTTSCSCGNTNIPVIATIWKTKASFDTVNNQCVNLDMLKHIDYYQGRIYENSEGSHVLEFFNFTKLIFLFLKINFAIPRNQNSECLFFLLK